MSFRVTIPNITTSSTKSVKAITVLKEVKRIHLLLITALPLFLQTFSGCTPPGAKTPSLEKPNIILVMIDNVGYPEFGIYGNELVKTPNLDEFAGQGIQFTRFYSNPLCAPTRASLMTGRYYYRTGVLHTSRGGAKMHGDEITIAELLGETGYVTGIFGKWHLGDNFPMRPQDQGFDEVLIHKSGRLGQVPDKPNAYIHPKLWENGNYVQKQGYCTDIFFDASIDFIRRNRDRPFFVYLPTNIAHATSEAGKEVPQEYSKPYLESGLDENTAAVCGMINNFDENFGRLTEEISALGLKERTIIIFLSDDGHVRVNKGRNRGSGYATPYEGSIRIPCFMQWPCQWPGRVSIDKLGSHIDILPTLLDVTGAAAPDALKIDGISLLPLVEGNGSDWPERMLFLQCERGMTPHRYKNCAVIGERYKLIGYPNTFNQWELATSRDNPILELYDLYTDPAEEKNLSIEQPEILQEMKAAYDRWYDDVQSTRQFAPGLIHIGSGAENPVYLSRYQDASYIDRKPQGWPVFVVRAGKYEISVNRGAADRPGEITVQCNGTRSAQPLGRGEDRAVFHLPQGRITFNAWVTEGGGDYIPRSDEDLIGDVIVRYISDNQPAP